jgi:chromosome segregation ATPase
MTSISPTLLTDIDTTPHLATAMVMLAESRGSLILAQKTIREWEDKYDELQGELDRAESDRDEARKRAELLTERMDLLDGEVEEACARVAKMEQEPKAEHAERVAQLESKLAIVERQARDLIDRNEELKAKHADELAKAGTASAREVRLAQELGEAAMRGQELLRLLNEAVRERDAALAELMGSKKKGRAK